MPTDNFARSLASKASQAATSIADSMVFATTRTIAPTSNFVLTAGYATAGDSGGARYRRVGSQPAHNGKFQSADGAWWEIAEQVVTPQMFGAVAGSTPAADWLEKMVAYFPSIRSASGNEHNVTFSSLPAVQKMTFDLNGSTLRNTNATPISTTDQFQATMFLGFTNSISDNALTFYTALSTSGCMMTLGSGAGANFAVGDLVFVRGKTFYYSPGTRFTATQAAGVLTVSAVSSGTIAVGQQICDDSMTIIGTITSLGTGTGGTGTYNLSTSATVTSRAMYSGAASNQFAEFQTRARVEAVAGDVITLDRGLTRGLSADTPMIGNFKQGVSCGISGITTPAYLLYAPVIQNGTLKSDLGAVMAGGGVIEGRFMNLTAIGRNGWSLNAAQDCLVDGLRFQSWRKICELAQGSSGTTIRNVRGTLGDASTKFGGGSDTGPFALSINENSADCLFDDFVVSSGPNNFGATASAALLGSGRRNRMTRSSFTFPAHTGFGLTIQSNPTLGNPNDDCGYEDIILSLPVGNRFIDLGDGGAGINRPYFRNVRCFGSVSSGRAASLVGTDGVMERCWFEAGNLFRNGTMTGWRIRDNWIPGGFDPTFTLATFAANNIYNNDSTANRAANGAALRFASNTSITTLTANAVWQSATFPAGSLAVGDTINVAADTTAGGAGANARNVRVSVFDGTTTQGVGSKTVTANGSLRIRSTLTILSDTLVRHDTEISGAYAASTVTVASIAANGLKVNVEAWVQNAADNIFAGYCEILPRKLGMIQLPSMMR